MKNESKSEWTRRENNERDAKLMKEMFEDVDLEKEARNPFAAEGQLSLQLFVVLSRAYKTVMEHALRDIRRHGLNPTEFAVLELLYHKGPHPLQQIGEKILLASGSITYVIDKLEEKGFLERKPCSHDRRVTYAAITEKGSKRLKEIFPRHTEAIRYALGGLDMREKETALRLLKKLGLEAQKRL
ncbi:hypothetical protein BSNK01_16670 [Bacillaceae bacterium]